MSSNKKKGGREEIFGPARAIGRISWDLIKGSGIASEQQGDKGRGSRKDSNGKVASIDYHLLRRDRLRGQRSGKGLETNAVEGKEEQNKSSSKKQEKTSYYSPSIRIAVQTLSPGPGGEGARKRRELLRLCGLRNEKYQNTNPTLYAKILILKSVPGKERIMYARRLIFVAGNVRGILPSANRIKFPSPVKGGKMQKAE